MDSGIAGEPKLLAQAHLVTTPEPDIPAAAATPIHSASFRASLRNSGVCCLRGFLLIDTGLVMSHLWLRAYSLSPVSTIRG